MFEAKAPIDDNFLNYLGQFVDCAFVNVIFYFEWKVESDVR